MDVDCAHQEMSPGTGLSRWKPSLWIWVPWIWWLFAATRTPSRWLLWNRPVNFGTADASGSIDPLVLLPLMTIGFYALCTRSGQVRRIFAANKWLLLLFVYSGLSIIWSNFPSISVVRYGRMVGALEMVLLVLTERYPFEAVRVLLRRLYFVHIPLSVITIKYVRNIGVFYDWSGQEEDWIGLTTHKNSLGQVAMCSGIFWLWQIFRDRSRRKSEGRLKMLMVDCVLLAGTLWMLRGSKNVHSSTGIVGFIIGTVVIIGCQLIKRRAARAKRMVAGAIVASFFVLPPIYFAFTAFVASPAEMVVHATGRDMTFTDRDLIWTDVLNIAKRNPMLGVGVGALWVGPIGDVMYPMPNWSRKTPQWRPEEAHNGYIDTYAQTGILGLILLFIVVGRAIAGALTDLQQDLDFGSLRLPLLVGILFNNLSESSFLLGTHDLWFLFLLLAINVPRPRKSVIPRETEISPDYVNLGEELIPNTALQPS